MRHSHRRHGARLLGLALLALPMIPLSARAAEAPDLVGAWLATTEHGGQTGQVALRFARTDDGALVASLSLPTIDAWDMAKLPVAVDGAQVAVGPWKLERHPDGSLFGTFPSWLVPVYELTVRFRPVAELERPQPPAIAAPQPEPVWWRDLGTPVWAGLTYDRGALYVGADDGRLRKLQADTGEPLWTVALGGPIRSRPTVAGDRVYVTSDDGRLHALASADGAALWQVVVTPGGAERVPAGHQGSRYDHYGSAVAAADGVLFVGLHQGGLLALDAATGAERWRFELADEVTSTPVVRDGRVHFGGFDGHVYALDAARGDLLWQHDTRGEVPSTPLVDGGLVIVGSRSYDLLALEAASGEVRWKLYNWFSWVESSAVAAGSTGYVGTSDAQQVIAFDTRSGEVRWRADAGGSVWSEPAVSGDLLVVGVVGVEGYIVPHEGRLLALDRKSGAVRWWAESVKPEAARWGYGASPAAGGGMVFAADLEGRVSAFRAE